MARIEFEPRDNLGGSSREPTAEALLELGLRYSAGRGVTRDFVIAHKWLNIAALRGNTAARRYRSELSEEMTRAEIARAQRLARDWLTEH